MSLPQSKLLIDLQGCWSCAVHKILCLQPCEDPVQSARSDKPVSIVHCLHHACAVSVPGWLHKQTLNATFGGRIYTISSRTALYPGLAKDTRSERMRQPSMREKLFGIRLPCIYLILSVAQIFVQHHTFKCFQYGAATNIPLVVFLGELTSVGGWKKIGT